MNPPQDNSKTTRKVLLILWIAFLWVTVVYWVIIGMVAREPSDVSAMKLPLLAVAGVEAAIVLYLLRSRIGGLLSKAVPANT